MEYKIHKMQYGECMFCKMTTAAILDNGIEFCEGRVEKSKKIKKTKSKKDIKLIADTLFSLYIRHRDNWRCNRCFKRFNVSTLLTTYAGGNDVVRSDTWGDSTKLHASHFFNRSDYNTRWDPLNVDALCGSMYLQGKKWCRTGCHAFAEGNGRGREWYLDWKKKNLGDVGFSTMEVMAHQSSTGSDYDLVIAINYLRLSRFYDMSSFQEKYKWYPVDEKKMAISVFLAIRVGRYRYFSQDEMEGKGI